MKKGRKAQARAEYQKLLSQHGWLEVNCDRSIWVPCPPAFPRGTSKASWARMFSQQRWGTSALPHGPAEIARLEQMLSLVYDGMYEDLNCQLAWLHLPDPRMMPLPVRAGIWAATGEREQRLRTLANADDPAAVGPPQVTEFPAGELGPGIKALRYLRLPDGTVAGALNYAWRSERYETDVRLFTSTDDLDRLQRVTSDIDDFVRTARIVERK